MLFLGSCPEPSNYPDIPDEIVEEPEENPPLTPLNLVVNNPTISSLYITWDESVSADNYELYRDTAYTGNFNLLVYSGSNTYFQDSGLEESTFYYYKIRASNIYGQSALSFWKYGVTSIDTSTPPVPQNLVATNVTSETITLSWNF